MQSIILALLVVAPAAFAQIVPVGFAARAHVDSAYYRGDTLYVTHTVSNSASSPQRMWGFVLETPAPVAAQSRPTSGHWFLNLDDFDGRRSAQWMALGDAKTPAGGHTPPLSVGAVGLPDVVTYWVVAYTPPKQTEDPDREPEENPMLQRSISGKTVGIGPVPSAADAGSLVVRLRSLLRGACGELAWISEPGVCRSLAVKLAHAQRALASGAPAVARADLAAFTNELSAQHGPQPGKHVSDEAFALLAPNVSFLIGRL
jgi:hypothetical protein